MLTGSQLHKKVMTQRLELRLQNLVWLERSSNLLHRLLSACPVVGSGFLPQDLTDVRHDLFHLRVIHGVERLQNSELAQRFHVRSGGYVNNVFQTAVVQAVGAYLTE